MHSHLLLLFLLLVTTNVYTPLMLSCELMLGDGPQFDVFLLPRSKNIILTFLSLTKVLLTTHTCVDIRAQAHFFVSTVAVH